MAEERERAEARKKAEEEQAKREAARKAEEEKAKTENDPKRVRLDCPPPPPPPEGTCGATRGGGSILDENGGDDSCQYNVRCMPCEASRDPRSKLEAELNNLVVELRDYPTLPADSCWNSLPSLEACRDDVAPLLPPKHCAFKSCTWALHWEPSANAGTERKREEQVVYHIVETHWK